MGSREGSREGGARWDDAAAAAAAMGRDSAQPDAADELRRARVVPLSLSPSMNDIQPCCLPNLYFGKCRERKKRWLAPWRTDTSLPRPKFKETRVKFHLFTFLETKPVSEISIKLNFPVILTTEAQNTEQ